MNRPTIAVVGAGKVGSALALLLQGRGYPVAGVSSRSFDSAGRLAAQLGAAAARRPEDVTIKADLVFITTPDREIAGVSAAIAARGGFRRGQVVAHTSGAHSADELRGVREAGAWAVSIHPLQSFASVKLARENLPGSYFALEGDEAAMPLAEQVVEDLGGKSFTIRAEDKSLYHAAACIASNYLVALMHFSTGLYGRFGLSREEAFRALLPLVQGTVNNIIEAGPVEALTGPLARGDGATVQGHLPALERVGDQEAALYKMMGRYTVGLALEKGSINGEQAENLLNILGGNTNAQKQGDHRLFQKGQEGRHPYYSVNSL